MLGRIIEAEDSGILEGVLVLESVGVDVDEAEGKEPKFSFISPYSFHSSTCSRS